MSSLSGKPIMPKLTGLDALDGRVLVLTEGAVSAPQYVQGGEIRTLVPTGDVVWLSDTLPVEVWVPDDRLSDYEHGHAE